LLQAHHQRKVHKTKASACIGKFMTVPAYVYAGLSIYGTIPMFRFSTKYGSQPNQNTEYTEFIKKTLVSGVLIASVSATSESDGSVRSLRVKKE
jgi:hypothetical protein